MDEYKKVKRGKRILNSVAYGAFTIGKSKAEKELAKVENEELQLAGSYALEVSDDVVRILTDDNAENRKQLEGYLKEPENRGKVLDMSLAGLRGVAIEKINNEAVLNDVLALIGVIAAKLDEEPEA